MPIQKTAEAKPEEAPIEPTAATSEVKQGEAVEASETKSKEEATSAPAPLEPKKKKARKRNKNNREQTDPDGDAKVGNGTPEEDANLTEQAQKGMHDALVAVSRLIIRNFGQVSNTLGYTNTAIPSR